MANWTYEPLQDAIQSRIISRLRTAQRGFGRLTKLEGPAVPPVLPTQNGSQAPANQYSGGAMLPGGLNAPGPTTQGKPSWKQQDMMNTASGLVASLQQMQAAITDWRTLRSESNQVQKELQQTFSIFQKYVSMAAKRYPNEPLTQMLQQGYAEIMKCIDIKKADPTVAAQLVGNLAQKIQSTFKVQPAAKGSLTNEMGKTLQTYQAPTPQQGWKNYQPTMGDKAKGMAGAVGGAIGGAAGAVGGAIGGAANSAWQGVKGFGQGLMGNMRNQWDASKQQVGDMGRGIKQKAKLPKGLVLPPARAGSKGRFYKLSSMDKKWGWEL